MLEWLDYNGYTVRVSKDVSYSEINLTVMPNGVAVMATESDVEIFKDTSVKAVDSPPFDSTTKIYNESGVIHYIDGKDIYRVKMK